jgi:hypothetical protein
MATSLEHLLLKDNHQDKIIDLLLEDLLSTIWSRLPSRAMPMIIRNLIGCTNIQPASKKQMSTN